MKYLKLFESFLETKQEIDKLIEVCEDICLELNDYNIKTNCFYNHHFISSSKIVKGYISISILNNSEFSECIRWQDIEEVTNRLIEYLKYNGWKVNITWIDSGNKMSLEYFRKYIEIMSNDYTFTRFHMNFTR